MPVIKGTQALIDALIRDEGSVVVKGRHMPYVDTVGKTTIGFGRNITDIGISDAEARYLLENDVMKAQHDAASLVTNWDSLDVVRQNVLSNLVFNMGRAGVAGFKMMLAAVAEQRFEDAADQLESSKWYGQVKGRGKRLADEMRTGTA